MPETKLKNDETVSRRAYILSRLEAEGQLGIRELSALCRVSEVTIRNDLNHLAAKNLLIRTRGGAIKQIPVGLDFKLSVKARQHQEEKQRIGRRAAKIIMDGETIILDSGTTTLEIAKNLSGFNDLTVITNALNIAGHLSNYKNIKVIILGGYLRENSLSLVGPMAEKSLQNYFCDKVFLGVDGFDSKYGISTPNIEEAYLNRLMIEVAKESIVVTDSSKFGRRSFAFIAPISKINSLVTDQGLPQDENILLTNAGIKVYIAE
jgi:DeoR family transcriptional regulator of aga operon